MNQNLFNKKNCLLRFLSLAWVTIVTAVRGILFRVTAVQKGKGFKNRKRQF